MPNSPRPLLIVAATFTMLLAGSPSHAQRGATRTPLTIERLTRTPSLTGTAPSAPEWAPGGGRLAFLWHDAALPARTLWIVDRAGSRPRRVLATDDTAAVRAFTWTARGDSLVYLQDGAIRRAAIGAGQPVTVLGAAGDVSSLALSPDGRTLSFLRDGDLWLLPDTAAAPIRATKVGVPPIGTVPLGTYFRPDVEIGDATWGGDAPAYAWSADSRRIAVHFVDRRGVPVLPMPYYGGQAPTLHRVRRSAPGDANEVRKVGMLDVSTRALRFIELPDSSSTRIVNVAWSPRGDLLIDRESDDAILRTTYIVRRDAAAATRVWQDRRETRIYNDIASAWAADGSHLLLTGDLDDRYRIYALTPGDTTPRALTAGPHDVAGAAIPTAATRSIVWVSSEPVPSERHVWWMRADGSAKRRLTTMAGTHQPFVSPDGRTVALLSSSDTLPLELYLLDVRPGATERRITHSPPSEFAATRWLQPTYVSAPSRTATPPIRLRILHPPAMEPGKRYPVLFGPVYSNTVRNRWAGLYATLQQYLAIEKGYIVVQVDVRGSTGYGRDFREKFLMDWGGQDLEDLESAVAFMKALPQVDSTRLGIWGSSYGGTLTVFSLLRKPGLFAAGVAGAPATDPRLFGSDDVAIARRPQTHPETFLRGALQYAGNLRDHLLIIHGMQDDVVPFATSVALADEFMRLGKDFDFAFAPAATHGWTQRPAYATYLLRRLVQHFDRHLGDGPR